MAPRTPLPATAPAPTPATVVQWIADENSIDIFTEHPTGIRHLPHRPVNQELFTTKLLESWEKFMEANPSRLLLSGDKRAEYIDILQHPTREPVATQGQTLKYARNVKFKALKFFELQDGSLYRKANGTDMALYCPTITEAFYIVTSVHALMHHPGSRKVQQKLKGHYYGLTEDYCIWVAEHCSNCLLKQPNKTPQILKPIVSNRCMQRVQIDLIDFRSKADGDYKWLLQVKDHFSRYVWLRAMTAKASAEVAEHMAEWYGDNGYPKIL